MQLTSSLKKDLVKHLQPKPPLVASPDTEVREAIQMMRQNNTGCVIVCDDQGRAVGIFTERDVLRRVIGERVEMDSPIKDVLTAELASVTDSDSVTLAIRLLHERGLRHLPVLDDDRVPVGVVSVRGVMDYLVEHFPQAIYNLPPNPSLGPEAREGA